MDSYWDHLLDHDALYRFDLAWQAEIGEHDHPVLFSDTDYEADPELWARLEAAAEERAYERGEA